MKKIIIQIAFIIMSPMLVLASGTTSAILDIDSMSCDAGMNKACYAKSESLEALVYNPAYACQSKNIIGISGGVLGQDINYLSLGYIGRTPFVSKMGWGVLVKYLSAGSFDEFDRDGNATGNSVKPTDIAFAGVFGYQLINNVNVGMRVHVISEKISEQNTGFGLDASAGFKTGIAGSTSCNIGITVLNLYTKLWDVVQPIGIGAGLVFNSPLAGQNALEYGIGVKADKTKAYETGASIRYSTRFQIKSYDLGFKVGGGYYYSDDIDFAQGIKAGLLIDFTKRWQVGYDIYFRSWGTDNRISLSYIFNSGSDTTGANIPEQPNTDKFR